MELKDKQCVPCQGDTPPMDEAAKDKLMGQLHADWRLVKNRTRLRREFHFKNFKQALAFTNQVGAVAESQKHHPDLALGWGYVHVEVQTHTLDNLVEADFILAAKIDGLSASPG